jgi:peptide/nickel transport system substrate-binding protein
MTRRDHLVVGVLLLAFAFVAAVISVPAFVPVTAAPVATPPTSEAGRAHVEGVVGVAERPHPLTARSQADRDIVALVFSGLVRLGRGGAVVPDIATSWTMSPDGATWTFMLRPDAVWHDGVPLTADDVVFTIETLQNPDYGGPGGASWTDVVATAVDDHTVRFHLTSPIAGFIYAATQPIVPAHLLRGIPIAELPDSDVGRRPVGSGPFLPA